MPIDSKFIISANITESKADDKTYHEHKEFMSASALKRLKISPAHYREEEKIEETDAMRFGSAYHCYVLEPNKFDDEFFVFDDSAICEILLGEGYKSPRSTNKYKEWAEVEMQKMGVRTNISKQELATIQAMSARLHSHPYAKTLLKDGRNEVGYMGTIMTETGEIPIKFKPDHLNDKKRIVVDLKTCIDASIDGFSRHAADLDYHIQAALYADLMEVISGDDRQWDFYFIAQEKKAPYAFNIFEASPQFLGQGRHEYETLLTLWKYCNDNDRWDGYQVWCESRFGIYNLQLPPWCMKEIKFYKHKI